MTYLEADPPFAGGDARSMLIAAQGGDPEAMAEVVRRNQGLVIWGVRRYGREIDEDDAVAEAHFAMIEAVRRWKPDGGAWSTVFSWAIRARLARYRRQNRLIHLPDNLSSRERADAPFASTNARTPDRGDDRRPDAPSLDVLEEQTALRRWVDRLLAQLSAADRDLLVERFGLDQQPKRIADLAQETGINRSTLSMRVRAAIGRLRAIAERDLR